MARLRTLLRRVAYALAGLVVLLVVGGFFLPSRARVERSKVVEATPCNTFAVLDGFTWFQDVYPWPERDPGLRLALEGPAEGEGAKLRWESADPELGSGSAAVAAAEACREVEVALDFADHGPARWTWSLQADGPRARVTASFEQDYGWNLAGRYVGLLLDRSVGADLDRGLERLAALMATMPKADVGGLSVEVAEVPERPMLWLRSRAAVDPASRAAAEDGAIQRLTDWILARGLAPEGAPVVVDRGESDGTWSFDVGLRFSGGTPAIESGEGVRLEPGPSGRAAVVEHRGSRAELARVRERLDAWLALHRARPTGLSWVEYVSDPRVTPPDQLVVRLYRAVEVSRP